MHSVTRLTLAVGAAAALTGYARPTVTKPNVVTITASDFAFEAPDTIAGGLTTIRLVNKGPGLHHAVLVRMDEGKTTADVMEALKQQGPPPSWIHDVPGPNAPAPGKEANVTVVLQPGNYTLLCFVDVPDHVPHAMKGMVRSLTVTPAYGAAKAALPAASETMTLKDYAFDLSKPLRAGHHVIRVTNDAKQPHEVEFVRLAPGKTTQDMLGWLNKMDGPPPGEPLGGVVGIEPGAAANVAVDLTPGNYALICFLPDAADGKPHFMHGMTREISVK